MKLMRNVSKLSHTLSKYKHKFATIQIHSTLVRIIPRFWTVNCRCFAMRCLSCVHTDSTGTRHPLPDMRTQLIYATRYQISEHKLYTTHVARCQLTIDIQPRCQMSANNWYTPPPLPDVRTQMIYYPYCQISDHTWYIPPPCCQMSEHNWYIPFVTSPPWFNLWYHEPGLDFVVSEMF